MAYKHSCISVMLESFLWVTKLQIQPWVATYFILDELNLNISSSLALFWLKFRPKIFECVKFEFNNWFSNLVFECEI